jgi:hypothetical protein
MGLDFTTLPDDPELAFVAVEQHLRNDLFQMLREIDENGYEASNSAYICYMSGTIAAATAYGLEMPKSWSVPSHNVNVSLTDAYKDFITDVDHITIQIKIAHARNHRRYSYALSDPDKRKIRHFGEQIKAIVDESDLPLPKKESLLKKLNEFLAAVDRHRTGLETFSDFFIAMTHLGGEAIQQLDKARPLIDSISRLLGRYQDMEDANRQVPHEERKKIGPPKREEPPAMRKRGRSDMDDDIPF